VRVVIGEDEALLRDATQLHRPDLVVTDIRMPPSNADDGLRAAIEIRQNQPGTAVVVLSQHLQRRYAIELLAGDSAGVGYLLKQRIANIEAFCDDLRRVGAGGSALDSDVVALMVARARGSNLHLRRLTDRQSQVLALMAEGRSNASIARRLSITEKAVVQHISHIYSELGLPVSEEDHRRVLAVVHYLTSG
jgi:DNA-binding NarL/FixJ family response regulator